jgi:branched-chain amino acid transport system ATP-binding protein
VAETITRFPRDVTVLLIEHDLDVALALADRVTVMHQGSVLAEGTRDEIRRDRRVAEIYLGTGPAAGRV